MQTAWGLPTRWTAHSALEISAQLWDAPKAKAHDLGCGLADDHLILSLHMDGIDFAEVSLAGHTRWAKGLPRGSWMLVDTAGAPAAQVTGAFSLLHVYIPKDRIAETCAIYEVELPSAPDALYRAGSFADGTLGRAALALGQAAAQAGALRQLRIDGAASALLADLVTSLAPEDCAAPTRIAPHLHARLNAFIDRHLDAPLSLDDLARATGLSKFHFARAWRADTGMTPMQYLRNRRLSRAHDLLAQTNRGITDIAIACGFSDHSHFTSSFRAAFGTSPSQLRAVLRGTRR